MRLALTVFGHTLTVGTRIDCPDDGAERDVELNGTIVERADPYPDHRVRHDQTLGFR